jgi:hypothetical protein
MGFFFLHTFHKSRLYLWYGLIFTCYPAPGCLIRVVGDKGTKAEAKKALWFVVEALTILTQLLLASPIKKGYNMYALMLQQK